MKVLFVSSGNVKGFGVVPFIKEQGESLGRLGIEVDYYPIVGKGLLGYVKAGWKLRSYLKTNSYDLIHAHFTLSGWAALLGAGNTPLVLSLMGSDAYGEYVGVNKVQPGSRYLSLLTLLIQPFVRAIISKSANIEKWVYLKHKSFIVPNGINTQKFKPQAREETPVQGVGERRQQVLFLGSKANVRKNFALARAAVDQLNLPQVELINPYPIAHADIPACLQAADVLVVPSLMEGSPNVIKEAMACNCPIVATDTGDIRWVFGDTPGCYLAAFDVEDFARKIRQALDFAATQGRTQGAARIEALGLDAGTVAGRLAAVYSFALKQYPAAVAG